MGLMRMIKDMMVLKTADSTMGLHPACRVSMKAVMLAVI